MNWKNITLFLLLVILFVFSGIYNQVNHKDITIYLNNPEDNDKQKISLSGTVLKIDNDEILLKDSMYGKEILLKYVYDKFQIGQFINFQGIFHKEGYIEYKKGEEIWDRKIKLILSIFGFLFVVYVFIIDYKKINLFK